MLSYYVSNDIVHMTEGKNLDERLLFSFGKASSQLLLLNSEFTHSRRQLPSEIVMRWEIIPITNF